MSTIPTSITSVISCFWFTLLDFLEISRVLVKATIISRLIYRFTVIPVLTKT